MDNKARDEDTCKMSWRRPSVTVFKAGTASPRSLQIMSLLRRWNLFTHWGNDSAEVSGESDSKKSCASKLENTHRDRDSI